jgi:hypothetical protein
MVPTWGWWSNPQKLRCSIRSWAGPTGQPFRYVDGTSAAVIVATESVNDADATVVDGAGVDGAGVATVVDVVVGAVVAVASVVVTAGLVVDEVARFLITAADLAGEPWQAPTSAPTAARAIAAPTRR